MQKEDSSYDGNFFSNPSSAVGGTGTGSGTSSAGDDNSFFIGDFSSITKKNNTLFNYSLFSPPCPSTSPSENSFEFSDAIVTDNHPNEASYILEYQKLYSRYTLCLSHLQESIKELDSLRLENEDLAQRLRLLSQSTIQNCLAIGAKSSATFSAPPPTDHNRHDHFSLPKSISVRSNGYVNIKPNSVSKGNNTTRNCVNNVVSGPERVYVPGSGERDEASFELEAYNQGVIKTELCNKWEETGACPYGDNCQYAHGIAELRPVMRHPRYKTQVCRMIMAGDICPYGHRCHFRHSLTYQETLITSQAQR